MKPPAVIEKLSPRQGKVLRYVVTTKDQPVSPDKCVVGMPWSDLPKTDMQARKTLDALRRLGLVERVDKGFYTSTQAGQEAVAYASANKLWQTPPPPKKTNKYLHTEKPKGKQRK